MNNKQTTMNNTQTTIDSKQTTMFSKCCWLSSDHAVVYSRQLLTGHNDQRPNNVLVVGSNQQGDVCCVAKGQQATNNKQQNGV